MAETRGRLVARGEQFFLRDPDHGGRDQTRQITAAVDSALRSVRCPRALRGPRYSRCGVASKRKWDWGQPHDRPVPCRPYIGWSGECLASPLEVSERSQHRLTDVETLPSGAQISLPVPANVAPELVTKIPAGFDDAFGKAQRHRRIVRPLPRLERERAASDQVSNRLEAPWNTELESRSERISDRQPEKGSAIAAYIERHPSR